MTMNWNSTTRRATTANRSGASSRFPTPRRVGGPALRAAARVGCMAVFLLLFSINVFSQPAIPMEWFCFPKDMSTAFGSLPIACSTNLISEPVALFDGVDNALVLDTTNLTPAFLEYAVQDSNGVNNFSYNPGAFLGMFCPNWASVSQGGFGPGAPAMFFGSGDWSSGSPNGLFVVYADAGGSNIFVAGVGAGVTNVYASAGISWSSNTFHQIGVEWSSSGTRRNPGIKLCLDGNLVATGLRLSIVPEMEYDSNGFCTNGLFIGSDSMGGEQMRGAMWSCVTWNEMYNCWYTNSWIETSNALAAWQATLGGAGIGFGAMMGRGLGMDMITSAPAVYPDGGTNYADYTNFWLGAGTPGTSFQASIQNTQSNLTYQLLTNSVLDPILSNWGIFATVTATNSVISLPPINPGSNALFLDSQLVWSTTTNGLPDWWQMEYFGNLLEPSNGCFDGDGVPDLQKYLTGADPNVIAFDIAFMNQFVNLTNVPLSLGILGGVPYNYAVLVDNTNFGGASWMPYTSSNITAYLGTNEGWHTVWVGLRGLPADAQQTWNSVTLDLDLTRPTVVITSPAAGSTVDVPVIQVQGFCPEPLGSISYDLTNAAGLVANQQVLVVEQCYDTNNLVFTTNFFLAFDVPLTIGLNTFTFHAADLAGNVAVKTFSVTLDYANKTTPQVQVNWPPAGGIVCGNSFVCCGSVSDPTATVAVEMADSFGDTNIITAEVGRDGDFYAENLPLTNGENDLTLTVTDAAGNMTKMYLTITQGDIGLNIDSVAAGQTNVTGEIGPGDFSIWVNGVEATINGLGGWTAEIAPIGASGGTVEATAVSSSGQTQRCLLVVPAPSGVYISSYHEFLLEQDYDTALSTNIYQLAWQDGQGGTATNLGLDLYAYPYPAIFKFTTGSTQWPATSWPQSLPLGVLTDNVQNNGGDTNTYTYTNCGLVFAEEHCNLSFSNMWPGEVLQRKADARMTLATGGTPGSTKTNLWLISCMATNYSLPFLWLEAPWWQGLSGAPVNPTNITILGRQLDSSGHLYVWLPDKTSMDVTPVLRGLNNNYYTFNVTAANITPRLLLSDGTVLSGVVNLSVQLGVPSGELATVTLLDGGIPVASAIHVAPFEAPDPILTLDTAYLSNGVHSLSVYVCWIDPGDGTEDGTGALYEADSPAVTVTVSNEISYPDWMPQFGELGNSLLVRAQSAHANADWYLDMYDSQSNYIGTIPGTTTDGSIYVVWNLIGPDGTLHTDNAFEFVLRTVFDDPVMASEPLLRSFNSAAKANSSGPPTASAPLPPSYKVTDPWSGPGDWVVVNQQAWNGMSGSDELDKMTDGFVQAAQTLGLTVRPTPQNGAAYRIRYGDPNAPGDWSNFRAALYNAHSRNLFYLGHASPIGLGAAEANPNLSELATEIGTMLHTIPAGQANSHKYRFVCLDGCSTACATLPKAFGITNKEDVSLSDYMAASLRPCAFAGWADDKVIGVNALNQINLDHVTFFQNFLSEWARGTPLKKAFLDAGRNPNVTTLVTTTLKVFGYWNLGVNQFNQ